MKSCHFLFIFIALLCLSKPMFGQKRTGQTSPIIDSIQVQGLQFIAEDKVFNILSSQVHTHLSPSSVQEDIHALFQLGLFKDIQVLTKKKSVPNHIDLIFKLKENKRIAQIKFKGISIVSKKTLEDSIKLKQYSILQPNSITAAIRTFQQIYESKGLLQTHITYEIKDINETSVALTFIIKETTKNFITKFNITGTKFYYPIDIERSLQSAKIDCLSWMNSSGIYQTQKINQDLQIIAQLYLKKGFIKVHVDKPEITLIESDLKQWNAMHINLHITEGEQYYTGNVNIVSDDDNELLFGISDQIKKLALQQGNVFNPFLLQQDRAYLTQLYGNQGFAFARITPQTRINKETRQVNVTYHITRGEKAYIERIEIAGNNETQDQVIRRELDIHDSELFSQNKLLSSKENLQQLGFFTAGTGVQVIRSQSHTNVPNHLNYKVLVEEAKTGSFNGGLSYSGLNGIAINGTITKKNLFGTGKTINLSFELYQRGQSHYNFTLTTPYWLGTLFTQTSNIYSSIESYTDYDIQNYGFQFGFYYPIWKHITLGNTYGWNHEKYSDISARGKQEIEDKYRTISQMLSTSLVYSTVDNPMFPSSGLEVRFNVSQYGNWLGGDLNFQELTTSTQYFYPLNKSHSVVVRLSGSAKQLLKVGAKEPISTYRRFYLGGPTTIRGFDWDDIAGPANEAENDGFDISNKYPYQGDYTSCITADCLSLPATLPEDRKYYVQHRNGITQLLLNAELLFPLTRQGNMLKGVAFYDAGNVWSENKMYEIVGKTKKLGYLRASSGMGIRVITPMGVLHFDYGIKIHKRKTESPSRFDFSIASLF